MLITIIAQRLEALPPLPQAHSVIRMSWASERNFSRGYEDRCRAPKIRREAKKKVSLKFGPMFCPKVGEEQKKEKVFNQIWSHFLPKIGCRPECTPGCNTKT